MRLFNPTLNYACENKTPSIWDYPRKQVIAASDVGLQTNMMPAHCM